MGKKIRSLIIEDEQDAAEVLGHYLAKHFGDSVEVLDIATNLEQAFEMINQHRPELVLTDIELGNHTCFELLDMLDTADFRVVFITGHNHYAIKAIRYAALDYIVKPVSLPSLKEMMDRVRQAFDKDAQLASMQLARQNLKEKKFSKLGLPVKEGIVFLEVGNIISIKGDGSYSIVHRKNESEIVASRIIKQFEEMLPGDQFMRIHRSYIINLNEIVQYNYGRKGGSVEMSNGQEIEVSPGRKEDLLKVYSSM